MARHPKPTLNTIGYAGLSIVEFLAALQANRIELVVDVRELPLSHKKGFSKRALQVHLSRKQIRYVHARELGCPRAIRLRFSRRYRSAREWQRFEQAFKGYLAGQGAALTALGATVAESRSALLCVEADPRFCHRSIVAQAVARLTRAPVHHIVSAT
ncbi:MAG TPA: DUF488 domain-containing protein [Steroidobacteraceae bacterium]|jgi:uncharacterized protein (DUF488 family)